MLLEDQSCAKCGYCERTDPEGGMCRRMPPTVIGIPVQGPPIPGIIKASTPMATMTLKKFSMYPPVRLNDKGCGRFLQKREGGLGDE